MEFEHVKPMDIEKRSMEIIGQELAEMGISLPADKAHIIKRVIHTQCGFRLCADTDFFRGCTGACHRCTETGSLHYHGYENGMVRDQ